MLAALLLLASPQRCHPEGLYQAEAGFFTRFDGHGHWATSREAQSVPELSGPYFLEGERIRFKLEGAAETPFNWFATFSEDCSSFVLTYETATESKIHFQRVAEPVRKR